MVIFVQKQIQFFLPLRIKFVYFENGLWSLGLFAGEPIARSRFLIILRIPVNILVGVWLVCVLYSQCIVGPPKLERKNSAHWANSIWILFKSIRCRLFSLSGDLFATKYFSTLSILSIYYNNLLCAQVQTQLILI